MGGSAEVVALRDGSGYDAFLSHSSADKRAVARIQSFLEGYSYGDPKRRVVIFRDYSDLPAGELSHTIKEALSTSRYLIVVSSPSAADSKWVDKEIRSFVSLHGDVTRIIVAVVKGSTTAEAIEALKEHEYLRHDLTRGWIGWIPRIRTRIELLRILATVTGKPMRDLVRWHLWRTARNWGLAAIIAFVPFAAFLLQPVSVWERIAASDDRGRVFATFADVDGGGALKVAYRFRGQGPQGFRNYFALLQNAVEPGGPWEFVDHFASRRRLLPEPLAEPELQARLAGSGNLRAYTDRPGAGPAFIGSPDGEHLVIVQPLGLFEEEKEIARDDEVDLGVPTPRSKGALILVRSSSEERAKVVDDLTAYWDPQDTFGNPAPPSLALPIIWDDDLGIWIGVPGSDYRSAGGLWHSADMGTTWRRIEGFHSVNSLGIRNDGGLKSIVVSELHFNAWRGILLVPYPSRLVMSNDGGNNWAAADGPPFGSRSEVEFAGTLRSGPEVIRIDENLFRKVSVPRWRALSHVEIDIQSVPLDP